MGTGNASKAEPRLFGISTALWIFGIFTTIVLASLWGRAVSGDTDTLAAATREMVNADTVSSRIEDWLSAGLDSATRLSRPEAALAVEWVRDDPVFAAALDEVVVQLVTASLAEPGTVTQVDVVSALEPLVIRIVDELNDRDISVDRRDVLRILDRVGVLTLTTEVASGAAAAVSSATVLLTKALALGALGLLVSGGAAVALADDRFGMVRHLLFRLVLSGTTFLVMLRIGAWVLDPRRGRSALAAGGSTILASNSGVVALFTVVMALAGAGMSFRTVNQRRQSQR
ncbi:hypothetical protein BMS3Bbin02_02174 [bacterium BMS3Bbin02]|nr:hypothetical protein BMS3Bbin02_02174 [bacterium BMS3Bbin02]